MAEERCNLTRVVLLGAACAVLGFGQAKQEQTTQEKQTRPKAAKGPAGAGEKRPIGRDDGIKVHGHWVMEIKNPDGSVASRKEFENSLVTSSNPYFSPGNYGLAQLLTGQAYASQWFVELAVGPPPDWAFVLEQVGCPTPQSQPGAGIVPCGPLTVTLGGGGTSVVFQGTTPAAVSTTPISGVATLFLACPPSLSSSQCQQQNAFAEILFTSAPASLSIQPGQSVGVTVTLSFS